MYLFQVLTPPTNPMVVSPVPSLVQVSESTPEKQSSVQQVMPSSKESSIGNETDIAPVEQILIGENTPIVEDPLETETDPLDVSDINDNNHSHNLSSEEESDGAKIDKHKNKFGLLGYQLYRCAFCNFSCSNSADFKKHAIKSLQCRSGESVAKPYVCVHCRKRLRNPSVLLDHVQTHGVMRFMCTLCEEKFATPTKAK